MIEKITCPNCHFNFDIEGVLAQDIKNKMAVELDQQRQKLIQDQKTKEIAFQKVIEDFEEKKKRENEIFADRLEKARKTQEEELKKKVHEEFMNQLDFQNKELNESKLKIKDLQNKELELLRMQRRMDELLKEKEIEVEKKMIEERHLIQEDVSKRLREEMDLKMREKDKKLDDQHKLIEELKRKSEQGSMQLQGEVMELAIEEYLRMEFPFDKIEEIKKGALGADTVQTVVNSHQKECGKIVYESKRTKTFSAEWIDKLRADQRKAQADIAVLVTQVLPKDMERFGERNGIWICTFEEFKSLTFVLRQILLRTSMAKAAQENKGEKMELLYSFLTSQEFKLQIGGIVDGFQMMKNDLDREKNSMQSLWKKREKQLEIVITNTIDMYSSIKGIAGAAVPTIDSLELSDSNDFDQLT
jgi:hypothetical protein